MSKNKLKQKSQAIDDSLVNEIKSLLEQFRDEEMIGWDEPFHYNAEGWATIKYFFKWLDSKNLN